MKDHQKQEKANVRKAGKENARLSKKGEEGGGRGNGEYLGVRGGVGDVGGMTLCIVLLRINQGRLPRLFVWRGRIECTFEREMGGGGFICRYSLWLLSSPSSIHPLAFENANGVPEVLKRMESMNVNY